MGILYNLAEVKVFRYAILLGDLASFITPSRAYRGNAHLINFLSPRLTPISSLISVHRFKNIYKLVSQFKPSTIALNRVKQSIYGRNIFYKTGSKTSKDFLITTM